MVTAFDDPAVREAMTKQGNTISIGTPEQAQATFRSELTKYAALVRRRASSRSDARRGDGEGIDHLTRAVADLSRCASSSFAAGDSFSASRKHSANLRLAQASDS